MSDRDPGSGDWPGNEWGEEPGSSVFGPRRPRPAPRPAPPPAQPRPGYGQDPWPAPAGRGPAQPPPRRPAYDDPWPTAPYGRGPAQPPPGPPAYDDPWPTAPYGSPAGRPPAAPPDPWGPQQAPPPQYRGDRRARGPEPPPRRPSREPGGREGGGFPLGLGALLGLAGLACFLAALVVLPWFDVGGEGVTLADIRSSFTIPETDPADLGIDAGSPTTLPDGIPTPDEIGEAVEAEVRDQAAQAAADAIDSGKARYLKIYTRTLWLPVAAGVALAVLVSTVLAPKSAALSLLLGFRRLAGLVVILAAAAHGAALWVVFTGDGAPSPATGVWLGVGGLVAVFAGCVVGPKS